jgi:hypothetical protein
MRTLFILLSLITFNTSASAQVGGKKIDELLGKGWEPFSAQIIQSQKFVTDSLGTSVSTPAYSFFLRKKGGLAYCVRSNADPALGFCDIIGGGQD